MDIGCGLLLLGALNAARTSMAVQNHNSGRRSVSACDAPSLARDATMSSQEPTETPYVYQPMGSVSFPDHAKAGRLWGVAGVDREHHGMLTTILGLTRPEAEAVCAALRRLAREHAEGCR